MGPGDKQFTHADGVSLRDYFESRLKALEDATTLSRQNLETRFESVNEWRAQSKDREATWASREALQAVEKNLGDRLEAIKEDVDALRLSEATLAGKASAMTANITLALSLIGLGITLFQLFTGG